MAKMRWFDRSGSGRPPESAFGPEVAKRPIETSSRPIEPMIEDADDIEYGWRVLVVCTANVSRSPIAEALLRRHLRAAGLPAMVRSAGTHANGLAVDERMVEVGYGLGVDVSLHQPRRLTRELIADEGRDVIIGLAREHLREIVALDDAAWRRTFTLKELVRRAESGRSSLRDDPDGWASILGQERDLRQLLGEDPLDDVKDPYRRSIEIHREVAGQIDDLCRRAVGGLFDVITV